MTKKDYIAIARAVDASRTYKGSTNCNINILVFQLSAYFRKDNPLFNYNKFTEAIELLDNSR